ncbi:SGNH/GDSL hydrolase family protein [Winogradskya humida]|uniref:SGNH hydrolase-type esterase domain-containing protein n=1 Tax=Winogradskya humida TaxID=113566 RepID=A0ABQ3ZVQ5_9ACTN|nr:GDSL-type esterase/lipase family protein [Actinoplanes humidus]GIE22602.1 hypothetical protein Ahu01nite_057040 [Actinoplanes humidus]
MRLAVLGDSHAAGLGVYGRSYAVRLAERLGADLLPLARTTQTVDEIGGDELLRLRAFAPTAVIVAFGASEGFVHPSRVLQRLLDRFAPRSWHGLEPRPYYSRKRARRWRQRVVSGAKVLVKRALIGVGGGFQRLPSPGFEDHLLALLDSLDPGVPKIMIGLWRVDDRAFPRSNDRLRDNDEILRSIAAGRADVIHVPTWDAVGAGDFLEDGAHLNDRGHDRVAGLILRQLELVETP